MYYCRNMEVSGNISCLEQPAELAVQMFQAALTSVKPEILLKEKFLLEGDHNRLRIQDGDSKWTTVKLQDFRKIFVIGFGKAVLPMAEQVIKVLGDKVERCMVNVPIDFRESSVSKIEINRGAASNIPDEAACLGTTKIIELVQQCETNDLLIVLITGGGSALLEQPVHPITIEELGALVRSLSRGGCTIQELNAVRKRLSLVKGGGLLRVCGSSTVLSLILSDVLGDPIDLIASGPTVPSTDDPGLAKNIIKKYMEISSLPQGIQNVLETCPSPVSSDKNIMNLIIGNNKVALNRAAEEAKKQNLLPFILSDTISGDAVGVGKSLGELAVAAATLISSKMSDTAASNIQRTGEALGLPTDTVNDLIRLLTQETGLSEYVGICLLLGGETTVIVRGNGIGGRNQELALSAAMTIDSFSEDCSVKGKIGILSAGTDGIDGPKCDVAGAVIDSNTIKNSKLSPLEFLHDNNSFQYFKQNSNGIYHVVTGHTETNVMDLIAVVIMK